MEGGVKLAERLSSGEPIPIRVAWTHELPERGDDARSTGQPLSTGTASARYSGCTTTHSTGTPWPTCPSGAYHFDLHRVAADGDAEVASFDVDTALKMAWVDDAA